MIKGRSFHLWFIFLIGSLLFISGCDQNRPSEQHQQYIANKDWQIKKLVEERTYILDIPNEILTNYEASGITFLRKYLGKEVTEYTYELKEKDSEGDRLKAVILELEGQIIGGYGLLPNWDPGRFNLDDKSALKKD